MNLSPWAVQWSCLSLQRWQPEISMTDIEFSSIQFWTQINGLEFGKFSEQNSRKIGTHIGKLMELENPTGTEGHIWSYLRIKVELDATRFWLDYDGEIVKERSAGQALSMSASQIVLQVWQTRTHCLNLQGRSSHVRGKARVLLYGSWLAGTRPRAGRSSSKVVGRSKLLMENNNKRRTWNEIMKHAKELRASPSDQQWQLESIASPTNRLSLTLASHHRRTPTPTPPIPSETLLNIQTPSDTQALNQPTKETLINTHQLALVPHTPQYQDFMMLEQSLNPAEPESPRSHRTTTWHPTYPTSLTNIKLPLPKLTTQLPRHYLPIRPSCTLLYTIWSLGRSNPCRTHPCTRNGDVSTWIDLSS